MVQLEEHFFGIPLSTYRSRQNVGGDFPYVLGIASVSIFVFRTTIPALPGKEPWVLRFFFGIMLAFLTYMNKSQELILAVELFSYAVPCCLYANLPLSLYLPLPLSGSNRAKATRLVFIAVSALLSMTLSHIMATGDLFRWIYLVTPVAVRDLFSSLVPTKEIQAAYDILDQFVSEPGLLNYQVSRLLFVTFHIQCGIGYLGIDFLKQEQERRNQLVRMDTHQDHDVVNGNTKSNSNSNTTGPDQDSNTRNEPSASQLEKRLKQSHRFQKSAIPFILFTAVPYMIKIIAYGNLNAFAYTCFKDDIHRAVRLYDLFEHDNHLVAMAEHSATAPEGTFHTTRPFYFLASAFFAHPSHFLLCVDH